MMTPSQFRCCAAAALFHRRRTDGLSGKLVRLATTLVVAAVVAGCGDGGAQRYQVSGTVTYRGQPVPRGRVMFLPEDSKAADGGRAGFAVILDGHFDTANGGEGHFGGEHSIIVNGFDGRGSPESEAPLGNPLFQQHVVRQSLPRELSSLDLKVK